MNVEEEHLDVLQNIEVAIQEVYRNHLQLLDYDVEWALNRLIQDYQHERKAGHPAETPITDPLKQSVYSAMRSTCEWRMGREMPTKPLDIQQVSGPQRIELETIIACLKRIRKSVQTWTKREGRQGYLNFTSDFV